MKRICTECSGEVKWLPNSVSKLEKYLSKFISDSPSFPHAVELKKNIAYNLQFLEFQQQLLSEFNLTNVIRTQTSKVFIIVGTSIVEAILYYLIVLKNLHKTNIWKEVTRFKANEKAINQESIKVETIIYKKLNFPELDEMNLHSMIQKAEKEKLLGENESLYKKLQYLRKLRNKVHIHLIDGNFDTDWNKFNSDEFKTIKVVLRSFMLSSLFQPSDEEKVMFDFLKNT